MQETTALRVQPNSAAPQGQSMFCVLNALVGSPIIATDGETGSIRNFLFDDRSWKIRYLVVDVGNWLKRQDVVIPVTALEQPDWANKTFRAHLTKKQMAESPDVDAERPVSRQQEIAMAEYFGPLACWVDREFGLSSIPAGASYPVHTAEDLHLRCSSHMLGYHVWATDGDFGTLEGFVMDRASWHLGYLDVKSGDWLQNRSVLVPTDWVQSVSWPDFRVYLDHTKAGI
ncbi:MAG: PRC-barrel domain-containing protein [Candidatus Korobacteraceae bacterium]